jgi:predicted membrane GTPase involved in stress response
MLQTPLESTADSKEPTSGKSHLPHSRAGALRAEHESGGVSRGRSGSVAIIGYEVGPRGRASGGIKIHAVDSSQMAFEIAAKAAFRQTMPKAGPELLEPIMKVDVFVPDANVGDVIGDLNRRRGMIKTQEPGPTSVRIKADVPLSEMFGYIGDLRSNTQGRGQFSMEFSHYSPVPKNILEKVKEQVKEREAKLKK